MSYTPEDQNIEKPLDKIIEGIQEFNLAANRRLLTSNEWTEEHKRELNEMSIKLLTLFPELIRLNQ